MVRKWRLGQEPASKKRYPALLKIHEEGKWKELEQDSHAAVDYTFPLAKRAGSLPLIKQCYACWPRSFLKDGLLVTNGCARRQVAKTKPGSKHYWRCKVFCDYWEMCGAEESEKDYLRCQKDIASVNLTTAWDPVISILRSSMPKRPISNRAGNSREATYRRTRKAQRGACAAERDEFRQRCGLSLRKLTPSQSFPPYPMMILETPRMTTQLLLNTSPESFHRARCERDRRSEEQREVRVTGGRHSINPCASRQTRLIR